ncbi:hypothetical protein ACQ5SO_05155 [Rhodovulum sp. DZ06]|uniref:hypothetical protein n=1 Tax=Rhodovulum sp. DZ06 TaxID=3425126 RepID=UPI003D34F817
MRASTIIAAGMLGALAIGFAARADVATLDCDFTVSCSNGKGCRDESLAMTFRFDTLTGDAFIEGNNGVSPVKLISGLSAETFIEQLGTGAVQTTTVNRTDGSAVHSRHTILTGQFAASQFYGACK